MSLSVPFRPPAGASQTPGRPHILYLPAELRQEIASQTISVNITDSGYDISTPLNAVCKSIRADVSEVLNIWLPDATTPILVSEDPTKSWRNLDRFRRFLKKRAASLSRTKWPGIQAIEVQMFNNESYSGPACSLECIPSAVWIGKLDHLPRSIKRIALDLTIRPDTLKALQRQDMHRQKRFWLEHFLMIHAILGHRNLDILQPLPPRSGAHKRIAYEVVGTLPESQVDAVAHVPNSSRRCRMEDGIMETHHRALHGSLEWGPFASFTEKAIQRREEFEEKIEIANELRTARLKEARQEWVEKKRYQKGFGRRMAELRKLKAEASKSASDDVKIQKEFGTKKLKAKTFVDVFGDVKGDKAGTKKRKRDDTNQNPKGAKKQKMKR